MNAAQWTTQVSIESDFDVPDHDIPENGIEEDDKLKEHWTKKERRRSSIFKDFAGDTLGLKENQRIYMTLTKCGKARRYPRIFYAALCRR